MTSSAEKIGRKFARLTVMSVSHKTAHRERVFNCRCDCGNKVKVLGSNLGKGTLSCGCLRREMLLRFGHTAGAFSGILGMGV